MQTVCAKVILLGEYALLHGGSALAIPLPVFKGELSFSDFTSEIAKQSNRNISKYFNWLNEQANLSSYINLNRLEEDIKQGIWFKSNIPANAGLGSSGAVVAAILKQYETPILREKSLLELKHILSKLEGYFHGTSSGIDPLISYLGKAVQLDGMHSIEEVNMTRTDYVELFHPFLMPINGKGKTNELVRVFKQKWLDTRYVRYFNSHYLPVNNTLVNAIKAGDENQFWDYLVSLSKHQMILFPEMIGDELRSLMLGGIARGNYGIKICGSGGGGFALGFAKNRDIISKQFPTAIPL